MRVSIWPTCGQPFPDILDTARHAEATGWDGVYVYDHFMPNAGGIPGHPILEAGTLIGALAASVPRVRIGTLVYSNTYRHPALVANMAATADQISGGRFTLGVGAGWQINEHEQYGITLPPVKQRIDSFVESLHVLKGLLRTPVTTFKGEYYQLTDAVCEPKPVQDPLPLLIGAKGEKRMLRVVAEHADIWNAWGTPETFAHKSRVLDAHCEAIGRDPSTIARSTQANVFLDTPVPPGHLRAAIGGTRAELAETIEQYRAAGLDELIVPDDFLGTGAERYKAMDTILSLIPR
jgi:F420-dependent oxidoreductase-like protein